MVVEGGWALDVAVGGDCGADVGVLGGEWGPHGRVGYME